MGASTVDVRYNFADKLDPPGVMFNEALGDTWWKTVVTERSVELGLAGGSPARNTYLRDLFSVAMAQASEGEVFFATATRTGDADPPGNMVPGIFQKPKRPPNIWTDMELPNLLRNHAITAITNVVVAENYQRYTDWRQGDGDHGIPLPDIDPVNPPPRNNNKRDAPPATDSSCDFSLPTTTVPTTTSTTPSTITAVPTLSCVLHNQDPDQGINQAYCLCNKSITLTPLRATKAQSESCAYSTMPGTSATELVTTQTQIWTVNCQACTIVGGIADHETCTTVAGCKPTTPPVPTLAAWVANSSMVEIGNAEDANNGTDLAKNLFTGLKAQCDGSGCKDGKVVMEDVEVILGEEEEPLKPAMFIEGAS
jgi:hypothetical protein